MNVKVIITINEKTVNAEVDIDGDIFTTNPLIEQSVKIISEEDDSVCYFTENYDLFTNCENVKIEKYVK
jgi:hypothetical protein